MSFSYLMSQKSTITNPLKKAMLILFNEEAFMQTVWDAKSDAEIKEAYTDNLDWQSNYRFLKMTETKQAQTTLRRWEKYIKPQVIKRDMKLHIPENS